MREIAACNCCASYQPNIRTSYNNVHYAGAPPAVSHMKKIQCIKVTNVLHNLTHVSVKLLTHFLFGSPHSIPQRVGTPNDRQTCYKSTNNSIYNK